MVTSHQKRLVRTRWSTKTSCTYTTSISKVTDYTRNANNTLSKTCTPSTNKQCRNSYSPNNPNQSPMSTIKHATIAYSYVSRISGNSYNSRAYTDVDCKTTRASMNITKMRMNRHTMRTKNSAIVINSLKINTEQSTCLHCICCIRLILYQGCHRLPLIWKHLKW